MKILDEIKQLKERLGSIEDTSPDYLPLELKELQNLVLSTHARMEASLDGRIYVKIKNEIDPNSNIDNQFILLKSSTLQYFLINKLSFREKLNAIVEFKDGVPNKSLNTVNSYRIEFAHPKGFDLREKYNYKTKEGRIEIRNLLRALIKCESDMNKYYKNLMKSL